ncbi:MAG: O-antigen polysaccharide polymerase Wzy, partial [Acidobacteriota bacterium]|nr:O-antigen polysaccharide polymerase Wzy [Acidobacteriota bacterium]
MQLKTATNWRADVLFVHTLFVMASLAAVYVLSSSPQRPETLIRPACMFQCALLLWMVCSWKLATGTLLDAYAIFAGAAAVFHTGQMVLECFNLNTHGFLDGVLPATVALESIWLVSLSFAMLHLGALLGVSTMNERVSIARLRMPGPEVALVGWGLLTISVVPAAMVLTDALRAAQSGGYFYAIFMRQTDGVGAAITRVLANFLIPGALYLLAGSKQNGTRRLFSMAVIALYCGVYLYIG